MFRNETCSANWHASYRLEPGSISCDGNKFGRPRKVDVAVHPASDAQHGGVEVVTMEHPGVEMLSLRSVRQDIGMLLAYVFCGCDEEACRAWSIWS